MPLIYLAFALNPPPLATFPRVKVVRFVICSELAVLKISLGPYGHITKKLKTLYYIPSFYFQTEAWRSNKGRNTSSLDQLLCQCYLTSQIRSLSCTTSRCALMPPRLLLFTYNDSAASKAFPCCKQVHRIK